MREKGTTEEAKHIQTLVNMDKHSSLLQSLAADNCRCPSYTINNYPITSNHQPGQSPMVTSQTSANGPANIPHVHQSKPHFCPMHKHCRHCHVQLYHFKSQINSMPNIPALKKKNIMRESISRNRIKRGSSPRFLFLCAIPTDNPGLAFFPSQSLPLSLFSPPKLINTSFKSWH